MGHVIASTFLQRVAGWCEAIKSSYIITLEHPAEYSKLGRIPRVTGDVVYGQRVRGHR